MNLKKYPEPPKPPEKRVVKYFGFGESELLFILFFIFLVFLYFFR